MQTVIGCPSCGRKLRVPDTLTGRRVKCPQCGKPIPLPGLSEAIQSERQALVEMEDRDDLDERQSRMIEPAQEEASPKASVSSDNDPTGGYQVIEGKRCPQCKEELPENAMICVNCGFDLKHGKQLQTVYTPLSRKWQSGMSLTWRVILSITVCLFLSPLWAGLLMLLAPATAVNVITRGEESEKIPEF